MMIIVVLGIYPLLIVYEFVPLYKQKQWRDFLVNGALTVLSLVIATLLSLEVNIPSPSKPIREAIEWLVGR